MPSTGKLITGTKRGKNVQLVQINDWLVLRSWLVERPACVSFDWSMYVENEVTKFCFCILQSYTIQAFTCSSKVSCNETHSTVSFIPVSTICSYFILPIPFFFFRCSVVCLARCYLFLSSSFHLLSARKFQAPPWQKTNTLRILTKYYRLAMCAED